MATRFEIVLHGENPASLRGAGEEAMEEIERLENQLSLFRPGSEVARLNREAHQRRVRVTPGLFALLERARELFNQTGGAFDITVAPLMRCWGFHAGVGSVPTAELLAEARRVVGMHLVELDRQSMTVRFALPGVMIDLGAIGKGHAVERAAELLREAGVTSALLHGGTSTAVAIGRQPNGSPWKIGITDPSNDPGAPPITAAELVDESLSVSAVWGRSFSEGGKTFGHIIDPRTGQPAETANLAAVVCRSATDGDALSTGLLTAPDLFQTFSQLPDLRCLVIRRAGTGPQFQSHGFRIPETF